MQIMNAQMRAIVYSGPREFTLAQVPIPQPGADEVRIKVVQSGFCGTDTHLHEGAFLAEYPLTPGHETVGIVDALGAGVTSVEPGTFVAVNPNSTCGACAQCRGGRPEVCKAFTGLGSGKPGGFAEYMLAPADQVFDATGLDPDVAVFTEPLSCVMHAMDVLEHRAGRRALVLGAGPTGIAMAQILAHHGSEHVTIAASTAFKLHRATALGVHTKFEMTRGELDADVQRLLELSGGEGYDLVVEATGHPDVCQVCVPLTRDGGTVLFYGVAPESARITISPYELFRRELTVRSSFCEVTSFPDALEALRQGHMRTEGIITHRYGLDEYGSALAAYHEDPSTHKIVIHP